MHACLHEDPCAVCTQCAALHDQTRTLALAHMLTDSQTLALIHAFTHAQPHATRTASARNNVPAHATKQTKARTQNLTYEITGKNHRDPDWD